MKIKEHKHSNLCLQKIAFKKVTKKKYDLEIIQFMFQHLHKHKQGGQITTSEKEKSLETNQVILFTMVFDIFKS